MTLPTDFQFSQGSLQNYVDCPRLFYLRYVRGLAWPAVEAEPSLENERRMQRGTDFHRLVHQHLLGIPPERLSSMIAGEDVGRWWGNYLQSRPVDLPDVRHAEVVLSAPMSDHRLVAKYDLIAADPGKRAVIVEWKTYGKRPQREWLGTRLQTRVYPYLLVRAGSDLNGGEQLSPGHVEMVYWFAGFPGQPERFLYDPDGYKADEAYLTSLIEEIKGLREEDFGLSAEDGPCGRCRYRSLCQRGVKAGALDELAEGLERDHVPDIPELEQIAEIEF